jgi:GTP-binding protein
LYQLKRPKIYYATQVASEPPTIILVCNQPQGFSNQYRRYLLNFLRDHLPFGEIPIKLYLQPRKRDDERDEIQGENAMASRGKPGEQWEGAFDDRVDPASLGKTGFEDVDLDEEFEDDDEDGQDYEDDDAEELEEGEADDEEESGDFDEGDSEEDDADDGEFYEEEYLDEGAFDPQDIPKSEREGMDPNPPEQPPPPSSPSKPKP